MLFWICSDCFDAKASKTLFLPLQWLKQRFNSTLPAAHLLIFYSHSLAELLEEGSMLVIAEYSGTFCFTVFCFIILPVEHLWALHALMRWLCVSALRPLSFVGLLLANEDHCPRVDKKTIRFGVIFAGFQRKLKRVSRTKQVFLIMFLVCLWITQGAKSKIFPAVSKKNVL